MFAEFDQTVVAVAVVEVAAVVESFEIVVAVVVVVVDLSAVAVGLWIDSMDFWTVKDWRMYWCHWWRVERRCLKWVKY